MAVGRVVKDKCRFFAHHPRTYPKELTLSGAPGTFGGPFAQNDSGGGWMMVGLVVDDGRGEVSMLAGVGTFRMRWFLQAE